MVKKKSTISVFVPMAVLLTIGAILMVAPTAYAEKTCVGACKNRGDTEVNNDFSQDVCSGGGGAEGGSGGDVDISVSARAGIGGIDMSPLTWVTHKPDHIPDPDPDPDPTPDPGTVIGDVTGGTGGNGGTGGTGGTC